MCGRYAFYSPAEAIKRVFSLDAVPELEPRYNVAPTQSVPAVRAAENGKRELAMLHWGLVPRWAKERKISQAPQAATKEAQGLTKAGVAYPTYARKAHSRIGQSTIVRQSSGQQS